MKKKFGMLLLGLLASLILFIALIVIQEKIVSPNGNVKVVIATKDIDKDIAEEGGITEANVDQYFKIKDKVDGELDVENSISSLDDLIDKIPTEKILKGQVVSMNKFIDKDSVLAEISDVVEVSIKATDVSQVAGGIIKAGDLINISIISEVSKSSERILNNVYVSKTFTNEAEQVEGKPQVILNIYISKEDEKKLNDAIAKGNLRVSLAK